MNQELPFLEFVCWSTKSEAVYRFSPEERLSRYERGWNYKVLFGDISEQELDYIHELSRNFNSWLPRG